MMQGGLVLTYPNMVQTYSCWSIAAYLFLIQHGTPINSYIKPLKEVDQDFQTQGKAAGHTAGPAGRTPAS